MAVWRADHHHEDPPSAAGGDAVRHVGSPPQGVSSLTSAGTMSGRSSARCRPPSFDALSIDDQTRPRAATVSQPASAAGGLERTSTLPVGAPPSTFLSLQTAKTPPLRRRAQKGPFAAAEADASSTRPLVPLPLQPFEGHRRAWELSFSFCLSPASPALVWSTTSGPLEQAQLSASPEVAACIRKLPRPSRLVRNLKGIAQPPFHPFDLPFRQPLRSHLSPHRHRDSVRQERLPWLPPPSPQAVSRSVLRRRRAASPQRLLPVPCR